jgi:hypothetical protein
MTSPIINLSALEPLYLPHEMPTHHRVRAKKEGEPAELVKGRRPSEIVITQNLRHYVTEWKDTDYAGASDTTRELFITGSAETTRLKTAMETLYPSDIISVRERRLRLLYF